MVNKCFCSDSLLEMPIGIEILISEESPYFYHYACKILGPRDFDFKSYKRKRSESSKMVVTTISELSLRFRLSFTSNIGCNAHKMLQA